MEMVRQVGNLLLQQLAANSEKNPAFPLDSLVAMTEGSIGFWLQNALQNALLDEGIEKKCCFCCDASSGG